MSGKTLKLNSVTSKNTKLKCRKFPTLQKLEIKMQRKISVLQYTVHITKPSVETKQFSFKALQYCYRFFKPEANLHDTNITVFSS